MRQQKDTQIGVDVKIGNWTDNPCYYVSIANGDRYALLLGPFEHESDCREWAYQDSADGGVIQKHGALLNKAEELDAWSWFYAWGMVKMKTGHQSGRLNEFFSFPGNVIAGAGVQNA